MNVKDYGNAKIITTVIIIVSLIMLTLVPYSIKYTISCSNRQLTYQYITIIPTIFLLKKFIVNIDDAVYFVQFFVIHLIFLRTENIPLIPLIPLMVNGSSTVPSTVTPYQR